MKQHVTLRRFGFIALLASVSLAQATHQPVALRCEYRPNPLGLDETQPRLTWRVESPERGQRQAAYQVLVASSEALLRKDTGDLWNSGKLASDQTVNVVYAGKPLRSRQQCFWKVRVWGKDGKPAWSEVASWTMGLLESSDWQADYISFRDTTPVHKDRRLSSSRRRGSIARSSRRRRGSARDRVCHGAWYLRALRERPTRG